MPELPEVEFAARSLRRWLQDETIAKVEAPDTRIFRGSDRLAFQQQLRGRSIRWVERRGKILLLGFDQDVGVLSHLGMTGKWVHRNSPTEELAHLRASFELEGGGVVAYVDPRLFGRLALHRASELLELPEITSLGPDPLIDGIDPDEFFARLQRTTRAVKVAIMDQRLLAGIGNIQATEALFRAKLDPARPSNTLSKAEVRALVAAIETSLEETLAAIGDEEITYVEEPGSPNPFLIYRKAGEPCPRCGTTLESMVLGGRTTVFCPHCQQGK